MLEIHSWARDKLSAKLGEEAADQVARMITDYVFANAPERDTDEKLLELFEVEMPAILAGFGDKFKTNATGVLILLGAAKEIPLESFKNHMAHLAQLGFTKLGSETPDVSNDLPDEDIVYMYEAASASD